MMTAHNARQLLDAPYFSPNVVVTSWDEAKVKCESYGARLATFHSLGDVAALIAACKDSAGPKRYCYAGWSNVNGDEQFEFVTGERMDDINLDVWSDANGDGLEPHNIPGHHCGVAAPDKDPVKIFDGWCTFGSGVGVVCEWANELECGEGNLRHRIGVNADISSPDAVIGTPSYDVATVQECMVKCRDNRDCKSYSWAPRGGDRNNFETTVCILYDTATSDGDAGPNQVLCRPCYKDVSTAESVGILGFINRQLSSDPTESYDMAWSKYLRLLVPSQHRLCLFYG